MEFLCIYLIILSGIWIIVKKIMNRGLVILEYISVTCICYAPQAVYVDVDYYTKQNFHFASVALRTDL